MTNAARKRLVIEHMAWARNLALSKAAKVPANDRDDLVASVYLQLVKAARRYRRGRGTTFQAFTLHRVMGEVIDERRRVDPAGRHQREMARAGVETRYARRGLPVRVDVELPYVAMAPTQEASAELALVVRRVLAIMDSRTAYAFLRYWLCDAYLHEIADDLGITESRACQLLKAGRELLAKGNDNGR